MNQCPLCNSNEHELLYTNSRGNKYLENYVCNSCGFVYTFPRISNDEIANLYLDGKFSKEARKSTIPNLEKYIQTENLALERIHFLEKIIPNFFTSNKTCLEIGCGTGSFLWFLKSKGYTVEGVEPDSIFVNEAKKRYNINVSSVLFDDYNTDTCFDLICNFHVIEHVLDPREFVKKIHSKLNEDGYIFIECPTIDCIYTNDLNTFFWDVHVNTFSNISLPWLLESEGFSIIDASMKNGFISIIAQKGKSKKYNRDNKNRIIDLVKNQKKLSQQSKIGAGLHKVIRKIKQLNK